MGVANHCVADNDDCLQYTESEFQALSSNCPSPSPTCESVCTHFASIGTPTTVDMATYCDVGAANTCTDGAVCN